MDVTLLNNSVLLAKQFTKQNYYQKLERNNVYMSCLKLMETKL